MSTEWIYIDKIRRDGGTQPRAGLDYQIVQEYAEAYVRGDKFPPVDVVHDGTSYWLVDGFHRVQGSLDAGNEEIECNVAPGTQSDAQWRSYASNAKHGLRRSNADKRRAVEAALRHPAGTAQSDRAIAEHVGVDHKTVGAIRRELEGTGEIPQSETRTGMDGRTITVPPPAEDENDPDIVTGDGEIGDDEPASYPQANKDGVFEIDEGDLTDIILEDFPGGQAAMRVLRVGWNEYCAALAISFPWMEEAEAFTTQFTHWGRERAICRAARRLIDKLRPVSHPGANKVRKWAMQLAGVTEEQLQEEARRAAERELKEKYDDTLEIVSYVRDAFRGEVPDAGLFSDQVRELCAGAIELDSLDRDNLRDFLHILRPVAAFFMLAASSLSGIVVPSPEEEDHAA
jgi:hypothetical protein